MRFFVVCAVFSIVVLGWQMGIPLWGLALLGPVCFLQNMAFTFSSRSRNSGDPAYHRYAAWCSNGVWFVCTAFVFKLVWIPFMEGSFLGMLFAALVYVLATTEGSVYQMERMLKSEKGKRCVGGKEE